MATASAPAKAPEPAPELPLPPNAGPTPTAIAALDAAISQAFPQFGDLSPDSENKFLKVNYLSAPKLLAAVRLALAAQGVGITSCLRPGDRGLLVTTSVVHAGGGWRSSDWPVIDTSKDAAVAISAGWGLRQNLLQLLALSPGDAAPEPEAPPQQWQHPAPAAPPAPAAGPPMLPGEPLPWQPPAPAAAPAPWAGGPVLPAPAPAPSSPQEFI